MIESIRQLLDALEAAEAAGAPLMDTVIAEALCDVIHDGFIEQKKGYEVPGDLLLNYTEAAERQNRPVVEALGRFLSQAKSRAVVLGLDTPEERERAFLECEATSSSGQVDISSFFDRMG